VSTSRISAALSNTPAGWWWPSATIRDPLVGAGTVPPCVSLLAR